MSNHIETERGADSEEIRNTVLNETRGELDIFELNADDGATVEDAAADVVQHLYELYGVKPITD